MAALVTALIVRERLVNGSSSELTLYGNVDIRELTLGFRVPGRLEHMFFEEGDRVEPGQELAKLQPQPYLDDLAVRRAQIRETEARLNNAEKNLQRLASLLKNRSISESDYDDAVTVRDELLARLDTAKAQLAAAETNLSDTVLTSPSSGTVLTRVREPGSVVGAGETVYTVCLDSPVWVRAYLDEPELGRVSPGQMAVVTTDSGGRYQGRVGFISPRAEFTPKSVETLALRTALVYRLRIVIQRPDQGLRQGMPVTIFFPEAEKGQSTAHELNENIEIETNAPQDQVNRAAQFERRKFEEPKPVEAALVRQVTKGPDDKSPKGPVGSDDSRASLEAEPNQ
jgi:HlyD family secretion protein